MSLLAWMRLGVAAIWLCTAVGVLHPAYRAIGAAWLGRLGLPELLMYLACAGELLLGLRLLRPWEDDRLAGLQVAGIAGFTAVLAWADPWLLVHPFGMLSKNLPIVGLILATRLVEREGWSRRATWTLRAGMAVVWITEGLFPKVFFQQEMEREVVRRSGLVPMDAGDFLVGLGLAQALSGLAALLLPPRAAALLVFGQGLALILLPSLVSWQDPALWVHPFGPMTKNLPILAGSWVLAWRLWRSP